MQGNNQQSLQCYKIKDITENSTRIVEIMSKLDHQEALNAKIFEMLHNIETSMLKRPSWMVTSAISGLTFLLGISSTIIAILVSQS